MKIGIFGNYNYASVGDQAILEGMLAQFRVQDTSCSCVVFAVDAEAVLETLSVSESVRVLQGLPILPQKSLRRGKRQVTFRGYLRVLKSWIEKGVSRFPGLLAQFVREILYFIRDVELLGHLAFWWRIRQEIQNLDILLIGGGNLLMDLFRAWQIYPLIYVILARVSGVPVMFYAVGAGPLNRRSGRFYLGWAARMANVLTFRDQESLDLVAETLGVEERKLVLSADPAFCLRSPQRKVFIHKGGRLRIGVSFVAYYHWSYWPHPNMLIYEQYRRAMAQTVQYVLRELEAEFVFFATNISDIFVAQEVASAVGNPERVHLVEKRLTVEETLALLASCDLMMGSRLHSLILSLVASTPAVAFSYQPKVANFYKRVGLYPYAIALDRYIAEPSPWEVVRLLEELKEKGEEIQSRLQRALSTLREESTTSVALAWHLAKRK